MIRVMLVDDQNLVRKGVRSLLGLSEDIEIVAEAADGAEAMRLLPEIRPDVMLLDMRMPGMSGIDLLQTLQQQDAVVPPPSFSPHLMMTNWCWRVSRLEPVATC